jgi:hypothetical protein
LEYRAHLELMARMETMECGAQLEDQVLLDLQDNLERGVRKALQDSLGIQALQDPRERLARPVHVD